MKKLIAAVAALAAFSVQADSLSVAATAVPHAEILEFVKPALAKEGVELNIKVFTDYVQPNVQVAEKRLDANFFQHQPYLDEFNKSRGTELVSVAGVHVEPFGAYSSQHKTLADLPQATFASKVEIADGKARVTREVDGGLETVELPLPAVITTDLRLNEPRFATLPNIMKAKKKPVDTLTPEALGVDVTPRLATLKVEEPPKRKAGVMVGSVDELIEKLRNEAKVI